MNGFGGDGNTTRETTVGEGRCITNGLFARLEAMFYDAKYQPHCFSRGFSNGDEMAELTKLVQPEVLEELMRELDFGSFTPEMERRAHHFISRSIRGDFSKYPNPYSTLILCRRCSATLDWLTMFFRSGFPPSPYSSG